MSLPVHVPPAQEKKYRWAKRIAVAIGGGTVVLIGVAMLVLPGPGLVMIAVGLGILGVEFAFARRWLRQLREQGGKVMDKVRNRKS